MSADATARPLVVEMVVLGVRQVVTISMRPCEKPGHVRLLVSSGMGHQDAELPAQDVDAFGRHCREVARDA